MGGVGRAQAAAPAAAAGVRRRFAPHQLRHAHAVEMAHEGVPLVVIQRQLVGYAGDMAALSWIALWSRSVWD
jgi:site-specific recombinase XerD